MTTSTKHLKDEVFHWVQVTYLDMYIVKIPPFYDLDTEQPCLIFIPVCQILTWGMYGEVEDEGPEKIQHQLSISIDYIWNKTAILALYITNLSMW